MGTAIGTTLTVAHVLMVVVAGDVEEAVVVKVAVAEAVEAKITTGIITTAMVEAVEIIIISRSAM